MPLLAAICGVYWAARTFRIASEEGRLAPGRRRPQRKDWYSISVDSLRAWMIFLVVVALCGVGFLGYRGLAASLEKREASLAIEAARQLAGSLEARSGLAAHRLDFAEALAAYDAARSHYEAQDYAEALAQATTSRNLLQWIADVLEQRDSGAEARFISAGGRVEFRRGETGEWQPARSGTVLTLGDLVRTSAGGSAEIMFDNGSLYTVRPNTFFVLSRAHSPHGGGQEQAIKLEYGWVNLNTKQRESNVATPAAEAWVERDSKASVSYDKASRTGRYASFAGRLRVAGKAGTERQVEALEQVVATSDALSKPSTLPGQPALSEPPDSVQVNLDKAQRLVLAWEPVPGAARYALQVSRHHLFVDNLIEAPDRTGTQATLGLQGEGSFQWRVAAVDRAGALGPWSAARKFRVASLRGGAGTDSTPPPLVLQDVKSYGNIFILGGATEPGAEVTIDGEPVTVAADGTFNKTIQLMKEGWSFVTIRARDAWGNATERRQRVFVEAF
jgi:hypothetical protein